MIRFRSILKSLSGIKAVIEAFSQFYKNLFDFIIMKAAPSSTPMIKYKHFYRPLFPYEHILKVTFSKNLVQNTDLKHLYFHQHKYFCPVTYVLLLCPMNFDFCSIFFPCIWFPLSFFQKKMLVDFVTAGALTKLPTEKSTAKPKNCSFLKK